jgi:hypothetical protein
MTQEKVFADGFSFKRNENAPDFVVGRLSIKVEDAVAFMKENQKNGWVNISIKYGRSGNPYCELDNFDPTTTKYVENKANYVENKANYVENDDAFLDGELPF